MGTAGKRFRERRLSGGSLYLLDDLGDISENHFRTRTDSLTAYMAAALKHKISFFPLQELCTLRIFFIFDFPFLFGKEEAKTIYSLCC